MIHERKAQEYCCDDISLIENFDLASKDSDDWICHHKNGLNFSIAELQSMDLYCHRPAIELIFVRALEHQPAIHLADNNSYFDSHAVTRTLKSDIQCRKDLLTDHEEHVRMFLQQYRNQRIIDTREAMYLFLIATGKKRDFPNSIRCTQCDCKCHRSERIGLFDVWKNRLGSKIRLYANDINYGDRALAARSFINTYRGLQSYRQGI